MDSKNFLIIPGWARTELDLKGNDLIVYSIIYGFSQTKDQKFTGSLQYLADWCGATKPGIEKNLKRLIDKGLILKEEIFTNNIKHCHYSVVLPDIVCNNVTYPMKQCYPNNIEYKKKDLSKDKYNTKVGTDNSFLGSLKKQPKTNLYSRCISLIDDFVTRNICSTCIRDLLVRHLDLIVEEKKLRGINQYAGILNKLESIHNSSGNDYKDIIQYSIEKGYPTFYEVKSNYKRNSFTESGNTHVESFNEEDQKNLDEFKEELKRQGKQIYF